MRTAVSSSTSLRPENSPTRAETYLLWLMAVSITCAILVWAFFTERPQNFDDLGLFNIPYMYVHYGSLTYPAHGEFDALVVHPPVHYWILGTLMKLGIPPYYAEALAPVVLIMGGILLVVRSNFPNSVKVGLLLAFAVPTLGFGFAPSMRPDTHRAVALYVGLIALESGRVSNWNPARLFAGSALLTWASILHYPGFLAFTGVIVYAIWILIPRDRRQATLGLFALMSGGLIVGLPFLLGFVIPHWHQIVSAVAQAGGRDGVLASLQMHQHTYHFFSQPGWTGFASAWPTRILFLPLAVGIPVILLSTLVFLSNPTTRGLALASLPYPIFLLLGTTHKLYWPGYFIPEFMLYTAAVGMLAASALFLIRGRWQIFRGVPVVGLFGLFAAGGLLTSGHYIYHPEVSFKRHAHETELARAAGRRMVGDSALVGTRSAIMFYSSGAKEYYDVAPDLLSTKKLPTNLREYFAGFDAIVEHSAFSSYTKNSEQKSLISWYADGTLHLRGFYFSASRVAVPYLALVAQPADKLEGFGFLNSEAMVHFKARENGNTVLVSTVCPQRATKEKIAGFIFHHAFAMPPEGSPTQKQTEFFIFEAKDYARGRETLGSGCQFLEEVWLQMEPIETDSLLASLPPDRPIRFYESYEAALDARWGSELQVATSSAGWPETLHFRRGAHQDQRFLLSEKDVQTLLRSNVDDTPLAQAAWYDEPTGIDLEPNGMSEGDAAAEFQPHSPRDHLATNFVAAPDAGFLFFSLWIKSEGKLPSFFVQDHGYNKLADARPIAVGGNGWVLLAGTVESPRGHQIRLAIDPRGRLLKFDKLMLVALQGDSLAKKRGKSVR